MCGEVSHLREASESGLTQSTGRIVDSTALAVQAAEPRVVVGVEVTKNQDEWCGFQSVQVVDVFLDFMKDRGRSRGGAVQTTHIDGARKMLETYPNILMSFGLFGGHRADLLCVERGFDVDQDATG